MTQQLLTLVDVRAGYGRIEVLKGISLSIREREIVTLIGANGAGKTTTLNTICGLVRSRGGSIKLGGEEIAEMGTASIVAKGLCQVPEGRKLFSDMTVLDNLEMGAFLRKDNLKGDLEKVFALFPILAERRKQLAGSLSGGEQQMCAIARALMAKPRILLLDEPSLGLAPILCRQIFDVVRKLNEEGTTIFLVEQNALAALNLAHRAYVMETGRITLEGEAGKLKEDPRVQEAYLGM